MSTPPILHAVAESVKTEIIPCTVAAGIEGELNLLKIGDAVFLTGTLGISGTFAAKKTVTIGTIPAGYRPDKAKGGIAISGFAAGYITVEPAGEIVFLPSGNATASLYIPVICWKIT